MSCPRTHLALLLLAAAGLAACGPEAVRIPAGPDLTALVEAWQAPTAPLDQAAVESVVGQATGLLEEVTGVGGLGWVVDAALGGLAKGGESAGQALTADLSTRRQAEAAAQGNGYLRVDHICSGEDEEVDPDRNGTLRLTATFHENRLDSVVWGRATRCRELVEGSIVELDGEVEIHLGQGVTWETLGRLPLLVAFSGSASVGTAAATLDLDLRFDPGTSGFEVRLPVAAGHLFASWEASQLLLDATNGRWRCSLEARRCDSDRGAALAW